MQYKYRFVKIVFKIERSINGDYRVLVFNRAFGVKVTFPYKILIGEDVTGESVLDKAVLTLTPNDATTTYGTLSGVTNDDEENALRTAIGVLEYGNDAAFYGEGGKYTADAATHNNAVYIKNLNEKTLTNYNVNQGHAGCSFEPGRTHLRRHDTDTR